MLAFGLAPWLALLAACGSANGTVKDSWVKPGVTQLAFRKLAVVMADQDGGTARVAEDAMVARVHARGIEAVPSYALGLSRRSEGVAETLRQQGFDGVLVMRIVGSREEVDYYAGGYPTYYGGFGGYYGHAWATPGYVDTDTYTTLETNLYTLSDEELVWSAQTEVVDASNIKELIDDAAGAAGKKLHEQGLTPAPPATD